jgi:hypothetical protein
MILRWTTDANGERWPEYTEEQAQRIARAAWGIHALLPHPDDVDSRVDASALREFNNAMTCTRPASQPSSEDRGSE